MSEQLQTHYETCWKDPKHHACAVRRIEELEAENDKQRREIAELQTFLRGHQHNIGQLLKGRDAAP